MPSQSGLKRTKTGCWKCRARRRKCDESKPRCQRCIAGNFECQYPSGLTFRDENTITVPVSGAAASPQYTRLQFVGPGSSTPAASNNRASDRLSSTPQNTSPSLPIHQSRFVARTWPSPSPNESTHSPSANSPGLQGSGQAEMVGEILTPPPVPQHAGYQTAVHSLLPLGTANTTAASNLTSTAEEPAPFSLRAPRSATCSSPPRSLEDEPAVDKVSQECRLLLLKHYRYEIAPWLDICDMGQTFGLSVLCIGRDDPRVLQAVLVLSRASMKSQEVSSPECLGLTSDLLRLRPALSGDALIAALDAVAYFISSNPPAWQEHLRHVDVVDSEDDHAYPSQLRIQAYYLLSRLELCTALAINTKIPYHFLPTFERLVQCNTSLTNESVFQYTSKPFLWCAKSFAYCAGEPHSPPLGLSHHPGPTQVWQSLTDELNAWYAKRPLNFQPMVEIETDSYGDKGYSHLFPTILFTNGAAIFANQLYHTAMFLLLRHKPRTLSLEPGRSMMLSPLWHAQRICGISLNNSRRECWDLCLLSSLYIASKTMTHNSQQCEIMRGLDRIATLTGWSTQYFMSELRLAWKFERDSI